MIDFKKIIIGFVLSLSGLGFCNYSALAADVQVGRRQIGGSGISLSVESSNYRGQFFRNDFALFDGADSLDDLYDDEFMDDELSDFDDSSNKGGVRRLSAIRAAAMSALLPGAGQWYVGKKRAARLFLGAEAGIWVGYAALKVHSGWKQDEVERFATRHAGVSGLDRDDQFFRQLTFYSSREQYNSIGRAFDSDLPFIEDTKANDWNWDSDESQNKFRQLFNDKNSADRNVDFMFIAALVNRLTSAALAWRSAKRVNNHLDDDDYQFGAKVTGSSSRGRKSELDQRTLIRLVQPAPGFNASDGLMLAITHSF